MIFTVKQAEAIFDVLVEECGAPNEESIDKENFVNTITNDFHSYRFIGKLGFGGKFYRNGKVGCYQEDFTSGRENSINRANKLIAKILDK